MKKNNKPDTPHNLSTPEQLREFREKNPLIYSLEAKKRRNKFPNSSIVNLIEDELESYINDGPRRDEDKEIFKLVRQEAMSLRQIIEEIKQARTERNLKRLENLCYDLAINYQKSLLYQDSSEALMSDYSRKQSTSIGLEKSMKKRATGKKEKLAELGTFIQQELRKNPKVSNKELLRQAERGRYGGDYTEASLAKHIKDIAAKERKIIKNNN